MAPPRRQPLSELPLKSFIEAADRANDSPAASVKRGVSPSSILSPPKRRILAAEGLISPSKSPAKRLFFNTVPVEAGSSSFRRTVDAAHSNSMAESSLAGSSTSGRSTSIISSHSQASTSTLITSISSQTAMVHSPSKLSISTSSLPSTPPDSLSRTRSLAPSPEIPDSPTPMDTSEDLPVIRPASLKRLRSDHSSSSSGASSSGKSPTPKRRHLTRGGSPAPVVLAGEEEVDDEAEDKENVPPPRKKKAQGFKSPAPVFKTVVTRRVDTSLTPRAVKTATPDDRRARRMIMEAEADMPDDGQDL